MSCISNIFCLVGIVHNKLRFPGVDNKWYVTEVISVNRGLFKILMMLSHPNAGQFRTQASNILCAAYAGDERLVQSIRSNAISDNPINEVFRVAQAAGPTGPAVMPPAADLEFGVIKYQEMLQLQTDISSKKKEDDEREAKLLAEKKVIVEKELQAAKAQVAAEEAKKVAEEARKFTELAIADKQLEVIKAKRAAEESAIEKKKEATLEILRERQNLKRARESPVPSGTKPYRPPSYTPAAAAPLGPIAPQAPSIVFNPISSEMRFASAVSRAEQLYSISARDFHLLYIAWWNQYNQSPRVKPLAHNIFGVCMRAVTGIEAHRESSGNVYHFNHAYIKAHLQKHRCYDPDSKLPLELEALHLDE